MSTKITVTYNSMLGNTKPPTSGNLEDEIRSYIQDSFPGYYHENITDPKKEKIAYFQDIFDEFKDIGDNNERHSLKWAFKRANEAFNFDQLKHPQHQTDCFIAYDDVVSEVYIKAKEKLNNLSRRFSYLSIGVSISDIAISVLLILLVTVLSHRADELFNTLVFSTMFIGAIAFTKVSVDRFAIIPFIDGYGWKQFNNTIAYARRETIKLNAILLVLIESINRNEPVDTRFNLITEQKRKLIKSRKFGFLSPKPVRM